MTNSSWYSSCSASTLVVGKSPVKLSSLVTTFSSVAHSTGTDGDSGNKKSSNLSSLASVFGVRSYRRSKSTSPVVSSMSVDGIFWVCRKKLAPHSFKSFAALCPSISTGHFVSLTNSRIVTEPSPRILSRRRNTVCWHAKSTYCFSSILASF